MVGLFCTSTLGIQLKGFVCYVTGCREIEAPGGNFKIKRSEREIRVKGSAGIEADMIEIHTGNYANAETEDDIFEELDRIRLATQHAKKLGLGVNAGHGLNYLNMKEFIAIKDIDEASIGQSIIARSVFVGIEQAIKEMFAIINSAEK